MELHPHPIQGNVSTRNKVLKQFDATTHHTILLEGQKGIGKSLFCGHLACWLLGGADVIDGQMHINHEQPSTKLIQNGGHPDFLLINGEKFNLKSKQIPVDALEIIHKFLQRQGTARHRIVIIDALDDCVPVLNHGLLKLLEEPPERVVFLLIAHQLGRVLDTIRSRTQRFSFQPLSTTEMQACLPMLDLGESPPSSEILITLSDGAPGKAESIAEGDLEGLLQKLADYLIDTEANGSTHRDLLQYVCHKKHNHIATWRHLSLWLGRQILRQNIATSEPYALKSAESIFHAFRNGIQGDNLVTLIQESLKLLDKVQQPPAYLDAEQTVQNILFRWHEAVHQQSHLS